MRRPSRFRKPSLVSRSATTDVLGSPARCSAMTSIPVDLKAGSPTMRRALPQSLVAWLFLAPAAVIFAVVLIYPMIYSAWLSLFQWDGVSPNKVWVGVENYVELFT